jgi:hypothetical protein
MINRRLYDILVKHQIYIEGFKNFQVAKFRKELPKLVKAIKEQFRQSDFKTLDEMTKRELTLFRYGIKKANNEFFDYWNRILLKDLNDFMQVDLQINKAILANYENLQSEVVLDETQNNLTISNQARKEDDNKIVPFGWIFDNEIDKLQTYINNTLISATGSLPLDYLNDLGQNSLDRMEQIINSGYADNIDLSSIENEIIGTKDNNYKDGILLSIDTAAISTSHTLIQNITSIIGAAVFATAFDRYQWISVMDSRTSDICISRNKNIYYYGKGPLPPAHRRCRSKTIPYFGGSVPNESFNEWSLQQSNDVQQYVKNGFSPLSLEDFSSKLESILTV